MDTVWPTIERGESKASVDEDSFRNGWAQGPDDKVELVLSELRTLFDEEADRRSRVEAKASGMLAAIGMSVSLGSGFLFAAVRAEFWATSSKNAALVAFSLAFLSLVYLVRAALHALAALERTGYSCVGPEDLVTEYSENATRLRQRIATLYGLAALANRESTNRKVDRVHLAQCYVRNAVVTVLMAVVASFAVMWLAPVRDSAKPIPPTQLTDCAGVPLQSTAAERPVIAVGPDSSTLPFASTPLPSDVGLTFAVTTHSMGIGAVSAAGDDTQTPTIGTADSGGELSQ